MKREVIEVAKKATDLINNSNLSRDEKSEAYSLIGTMIIYSDSLEFLPKEPKSSSDCPESP